MTHGFVVLATERESLQPPEVGVPWDGVSVPTKLVHLFPLFYISEITFAKISFLLSSKLASNVFFLLFDILKVFSYQKKYFCHQSSSNFILSQQQDLIPAVEVLFRIPPNGVHVCVLSLDNKQNKLDFQSSYNFIGVFIGVLLRLWSYLRPHRDAGSFTLQGPSASFSQWWR